MLCDIDYRYSDLVDKRLISPEVAVIQLRMLSLYHEALYISRFITFKTWRVLVVLRI